MPDAYASVGVSIDAGNETVRRYRELLERRRDPRLLSGIGAFGGCFQFGGYRDPVLVSSTDGVGTKVLVAAALERYDTIGRDLVHHCINDILCLNAEPLFFLDYLAVGRLRPALAADIVAGIADACADHRVALAGGETAEMPDVYGPDHFDLAGTIVGAVERNRLLDGSQVAAGDAIVGLAANGFHTNGYTLVRKVLSRDRWSDKLPGSGVTIADALLAVHPCYLPEVRAVQAASLSAKAMAHITGGGLVDNVARVLPPGLGATFDRSRWRVPPLMEQVAREAGLSDAEAYRTFNMGVGFCVVVEAGQAEAATRAAGAGAFVAGAVEPRAPGETIVRIL